MLRGRCGNIALPLMLQPRPKAPAFARALLRWYDETKRDLPWRRTVSGYRSLVSELMLQQTVVATVVPYFERFVARFPDVASLAAAEEDEVLALWSGLGYYRRARHLHQAAKKVMVEYGGELPRTEASLRTLPGVGEYTAAAIAAIAFEERTFALDGNAARVVARLFAVGEPIDKPQVRAALRSHGETLVPAARPGDFAQAVMELGARVCVAGAARCAACPVARLCGARAQERVDVIPVRLARLPKRVVELACVVVEEAGRVLLLRRPAGTLLGGTWTFPAAEIIAGEGEKKAIRRALGEVGLVPRGVASTAGSFRHIFTHRDVTARVVRARAVGRPTGVFETRWVRPGDLSQLGVSSFTRKSFSLLG
jgi:A/G-specific adenine glycosylase